MHDLTMFYEYMAIQEARNTPHAIYARQRARRKNGAWFILCLSIGLGALGAYLMLTATTPLDDLVAKATSAQGKGGAFLSPDCRQAVGALDTKKGDKTPRERVSMCPGLPYKSAAQFWADALLLVWMPLLFAALKTLVRPGWQKWLTRAAALVCVLSIGAARWYLGGGHLDVQVFGAPMISETSIPRVKNYPERELLYTQALAATITMFTTWLLKIIPEEPQPTSSV